MPITCATLRFVLLAAACSACAGKLEDPDRFSQVLAAFDASTFDPDAATGGGGSGGTQSQGGSTAPSGGTGGSAEPVDGVPACVTTTLEDTCGTAGCHNAGAAQIDLVSPGLEERLVDVASDSELCGGEVFISTQGGDSLLLGKLEEVPPCGLRMPLVGVLNSAQRKCLNDWVVELGGTLP